MLGVVNAGTDKLTSGASALTAYCVDLAHNLYVGATGTTTILNLEHLASNAIGLVHDADSSAAFQLASWDITFGATAGSDFTIAASGADAATVNTDVAQFLTLAAQPGAITQRLTYLQDDGTNGGIQNLVTFTPVPLPSSIGLLVGGVLGFGILARRGQVPGPT